MKTDNAPQTPVTPSAALDIDDEFVRASLSSGMDLRQYSEKLENELAGAHQLAVDHCIEEADKLAELHEQIVECEATFAGIENIFSTFLAELGTVGSDMRSLQEQSVVINQQLHNRQRVRGELSQFVDDMVVPHTMIKGILEKDANDGIFLEQLHELQHKLQFVKAQEFKDVKSVMDVHDVIENLKFKALEKIREWLLTKISLFKKPLTNYQIPQNALLKNRFFYEFLLANDRQLAREVKDEYVDTLSKMFFSYFKTYVSRLFKLQMTDSATKEDLLGADDTIKGTSFFSLKPQQRSRATVFSLGKRHNLLSTDLMAPLIIPHAATQANEAFQFESIFRSIQYALVDHCSHEFLFVCDFFMVNGQSGVDLFTQVMGKSIAHLIKTFEERITANYDAISLFLCICLCTKYSELMDDRSVVSIDGYWNNITKMLWSRLEAIMTSHNESVRNLDVKKLSSPIDTRPHYVIRRYAEFTCAILVCSDLSGKKTDNRLQALLNGQQAEIEGLLNRLATALKTKKEKFVFQINNYDIILTVLDEKLQGETKERTSFWELQQTKINAYVEEVLYPHFHSLIQFVNECEPLIDQNHSQLLKRHTGKVMQLVRSFGADWKRAIEAINHEILQSFTNFKNGTSILQVQF
uniref:Vacuolar protein sorting-associated protein 52 homolog n=1 Tax=Panagrolaimus sp. ES5 TaxID=591445 RepID=A0AC34GWI9_9BILA